MDWTWVKDGISWIGSLGVFALGTATVTGVIGYFGKEIFSQILKKGLNNHKSKLDEALEEYKTELKKLTTEHEVTFSKLHEERAKVIKDLYSKLVDLENKMISLTRLFQRAGEKSMRDKEVEARNSYWEFLNFYNINRIYFREKICKLIEDIEREIRITLVDTGVYGISEIELGSENKISDEQIAIWQENWKRIEKDIPKLKGELETEFRKLLGVDEV